MAWVLVEFPDGTDVGYVPGAMSDVVTPAGVYTLTNKTLVAPALDGATGSLDGVEINDAVLIDTAEDNGALTGTAPALKPGIWSWTLSAASAPTDGLANGQSMTLHLTPGANTIAWPTSTVIGSWPGALDPGLNVIVLWKHEGALFRSYSGGAA